MTTGDEMGELDESGELVDAEAAWDRLQEVLGDHLARMVDPGDGDQLVIELPGGDGTPYVRFAGCGGGTRLRAEIGDDWSTEVPVDRTAPLAGVVVEALRGSFGIAHPHLLTQRAWGPAAAGADALGLCATGDVPTEGADLTQLVGAALRVKLGELPRVDADGDYELDVQGQKVWVRVVPRQPVVEVTARVLHQVTEVRAAVVELALLNRDYLWSKWTLCGEEVWQTVVFPALPFAPLHLDRMVDVFLLDLAATRDDLALRLGAPTG